MTRYHIEDLVATFNEEITNYKPSRSMDRHLIELRVKQMREELKETEDALNHGLYIDAVDGLIDNIYFALGTLHIMGVDRAKLNACFMAVHMANMAKRPGIKEERRLPGVADEDHPMDAIKPDGWVPPEFLLKVILDE